MRRYAVISCDGHLEIPGEGWLQRLPARFRPRAPRLIELPEGGHAWLVEGMPLIHTGTNIAAGGKLKLRGASYWDEDGNSAPGTGGPLQRLKEQDDDGIDAEVLYPPVFISRFIENVSDRDTYLEIVRAYNEYIARDYCKLAPDRLIGTAMIPTTGSADAIAELTHAHRLGLKAMCLSQFPNGTSKPTRDDDEFWHEAVESRVAVTAHVTIGDFTGQSVRRAATGTFDVASAIIRGTVPHCVPLLCDLIGSGTFTRNPSLQIYIAETNAGWLPEVLFRMDDSYDIFRAVLNAPLERAPSEYVRDHIYFGIVRDPLALQLRDHLPVENLMWGSDFPHVVSSFPNSHRWLERMFSEVAAEVRDKVLIENPCRFFGLQRNASITETPEPVGFEHSR